MLSRTVVQILCQVVVGSDGRTGKYSAFHQLAGLSAVVMRPASPPTARGGPDRFRLPR
jgi:hypothetical protein